MSHKAEGEWSDIAPLRILSVDIECAGRKGQFPDAKHDPVIQIASHVSVHGQGTLVKNIMTLGGCAPIVGAEVMSFKNEKDLLVSGRAAGGGRHGRRAVGGGRVRGEGCLFGGVRCLFSSCFSRCVGPALAAYRFT